MPKIAEVDGASRSFGSFWHEAGLALDMEPRQQSGPKLTRLQRTLTTRFDPEVDMPTEGLGATDTSVLDCVRHTVATTLGCAMQEERIELLQRMPIFGGIRTEILQFLLALCPTVSVPKNDFFFREHDQGDAMFVLEWGKAAEILARTGLPSSNPKGGGLLRGDGSHGPLSTQRLHPRSRRLHRNPYLSRQSLPSVRAGSQAVCANTDEHGSGSLPTAP